jgi:hypothetical protein
VAAHHGPKIILQINQIAALRPVFLSQLGRRVRHGCAGLLLRGRLRLRSPPFFDDASTPAHPLRTCTATSSSSSPRRHPPRSLLPVQAPLPCCRVHTSFPIRARRGSSGSSATRPTATCPHGHKNGGAHKVPRPAAAVYPQGRRQRGEPRQGVWVPPPLRSVESNQVKRHRRTPDLQVVGVTEAPPTSHEASESSME